MRNAAIILLLILSFRYPAIADSGKPSHYVVIDTDGSLDDFRAINMFLAGHDFNVLGITASQGSLSQGEVFDKVGALLYTYYHNGIPIGAGESLSKPLPAWSGFARQINWGKQVGLKKQSAVDVIEKAVDGCAEKVTLVALGPLTNYARWIKQTRHSLDKIEKLVWYCEPEKSGSFNYVTDSLAWMDIMGSKVPLVMVSKGKRTLSPDQDYMSALQQPGNIYTKTILDVLNTPVVKEKLKQGHAGLWDDLVPLYLSHPDLFDVEKKDGYENAMLKQTVSAAKIYGDIAEILHSKTAAMNRVFTTFPIQQNLYKKDYAEIIPGTISDFGLAEWKAITLTNEVHGHTGIYSIIGAKAGIRACEYFNVGVNNLYAISFAGNKPPLSCFNDGIQISSGATIGQGLITVSDTVIKRPTVIFRFNNQSVKFTLNEDVAQKMQKDIQKGIEQFGMTPAYWQYVEKLARDYWVNFDRHQIFQIDRM